MNGKGAGRAGAESRQGGKFRRIGVRGSGVHVGHETTSLPTSYQLSAVTTEVARVRPRVQFDGCAIIASRDALFGMARMFEVFAEHYFGATRVFRTVDERTRWLELEPVAR